MHIPLHELVGRIDEVPAGEVWVHCAAATAHPWRRRCSPLAGRTVVAVDDEFDKAADAGVELDDVEEAA